MAAECRDSFGLLNGSVFHLWTCSLCYIYLFPNENLRFNFNKTSPGLIGAPSFPGKENLRIKSYDEICDSLESYDCSRWKECCVSAEKCCKRQQDMPSQKTDPFCPRTWDGWRCFDDTAPDQRVEISCPTYIKYGSLQDGDVPRATSYGVYISQLARFSRACKKC